MKPLLILILLSLTSCGTLEAYQARTKLLGSTEPDIISCMGPPDLIQYVSPGQHVLRWDYEQTGTDVDLEFGIYSLKLGRPGICHVSMRMVNGLTKGVHYQDAEVSLSDPDSICGRMVHECLSHREDTPLPPGFDADLIVDKNNAH